MAMVYTINIPPVVILTNLGRSSSTIHCIGTRSVSANI